MRISASNFSAGSGVDVAKKRIYFFTVCLRNLFLIPLLCLVLGMQTVYGAEQLVPVGRTVGVTLDMQGLLVLGTGNVDGINTPSKGILQAGDHLLEANGQILENKEVLIEVVEESAGEPVALLLKRKGREYNVLVEPVFSNVDDAYKMGVWIRDSIQGIGTVTCYDPATEEFCALGHGVYDVDTDTLMEIREGSLVHAELTEIIKGQTGKAGELTGTIHLEEKFAKIEKNTEKGIFGRGQGACFAGKSVPAAMSSEVKKGKAVILSDLEGGKVREYEIKIEDIRKNGGRECKDMVIRITDERLLQLTGGIIQGMSGSPILQNGKLVGAVTHVLVNDPTRGYGIFIENMLVAAR